MTLLLVAIVILVVTGFAALCAGRSDRVATLLAAGGAVAGSLLGLIPAVRALAGATVASIHWSWNIPGGSFSLRLDPLSAFFLIPIFVLSALAAIYGGSYMRGVGEKRPLGPSWCCFNTFVAGMALVTVAHNAVLFMMAWEVMSMAAFFLVAFEHEKREARIAGWVYLVAAHVGAAFLLAMFLLLGRHAGSLDFDRIVAAGPPAPASAALVFAFALVGFGTKAGLVPLHVWLPEAHPAAPSHVSALMSGVMIKLGIYGLLRTMMHLGGPASWWGPLFVVIGLATALAGVGLALCQRDLKRSLAYSSIENVGLIVLALGVGLWGLTGGHAAVAALGFAGGLLHIWNHALMKGLMFLCAGSVLHGAGTKDVERLGGLMKRMPQTGLAMAAGAIALSALPPLNGFVSEWLIYMGMLRGGLDFTGPGRILLLLAVGALALVGGLALIAFVRLPGIVLLGEPRSEGARHAHEASRWMTVPLAVLLAFCLVVALFPCAIVGTFAKVVAVVFHLPAAEFTAVLGSAQSPLATLGLINVLVWLLIAWCALALFLLRRGKPEAADTTWACGYTAPTVRMQYTGLSFSQLLVSRLFPKTLRPETAVTAPDGLFPATGALATELPEPFSRGMYVPFFERWAARFARLRWLQQGRIHIYLLYFVVVLLLAFGWVVLRRWVMW